MGVIWAAPLATKFPGGGGGGYLGHFLFIHLLSITECNAR